MFLFYYRLSVSVSSVSSVPQQPEQQEQDEQKEQELPLFSAFLFVLQEQLSGQPIHFLPLFFAFIMYAEAPPIISTIIAITIISISSIFYLLNADFFFLL